MSELDLKKLPTHIAIIMDGNGRWAKSRNLSRAQGHIAGVRRVEELVEFANEIGIKVITLYTFSTENWSRPETEVSMLMNTITSVLQHKAKKLQRLNMKFRTIGRRERIPENVQNAIDQVVEITKDNKGLTINLAFNYGSRTELIDAFKSVCQNVVDQKVKIDEIDETMISDALYTRGLPDPDLLIRTSGELRISNFLLWQLSYAEFYFTDKYWPDFTIDEFKKALVNFQDRDRRFGNLSNQKAKV